MSDNVYTKAGAQNVNITEINNTRALLQSNLGTGQIGIQTDNPTHLVFKDQLGNGLYDILGATGVNAGNIPYITNPNGQMLNNSPVQTNGTTIGIGCTGVAGSMVRVKSSGSGAVTLPGTSPDILIDNYNPTGSCDAALGLGGSYTGMQILGRVLCTSDTGLTGSIQSTGSSVLKFQSKHEQSNSYDTAITIRDGSVQLGSPNSQFFDNVGNLTINGQFTIASSLSACATHVGQENAGDMRFSCNKRWTNNPNGAGATGSSQWYQYDPNRAVAEYNISCVSGASTHNWATGNTNTNAYSQKMVLDQNGNLTVQPGSVGIGLSLPMNLLHINAPGTTGAYIQLTDPSVGYTTWNSGVLYGKDAGENAYIRSPYQKNISLVTDGGGGGDQVMLSTNCLNGMTVSVPATFNGYLTASSTAFFGGQIESTLGSGAPITVTSGALCTNLNANFVNGLSFDTGWTDYSSTSTITGWSSLSTKSIKYLCYGKFMMVSYNLQGTSNSTSTAFTLPYNIDNSGMTFYDAVVYATDNSTPKASPARVSIADAGSTVAFTPDCSGTTTWTASNTKMVSGSFIVKRA